MDADIWIIGFCWVFWRRSLSSAWISATNSGTGDGWIITFLYIGLSLILYIYVHCWIIPGLYIDGFLYLYGPIYIYIYIYGLYQHGSCYGLIGFCVHGFWVGL